METVDLRYPDLKKRWKVECLPSNQCHPDYENPWIVGYAEDSNPTLQIHLELEKEDTGTALVVMKTKIKFMPTSGCEDSDFIVVQHDELRPKESKELKLNGKVIFKVTRLG